MKKLSTVPLQWHYDKYLSILCVSGVHMFYSTELFFAALFQLDKDLRYYQSFSCYNVKKKDLIRSTDCISRFIKRYLRTYS